MIPAAPPPVACQARIAQVIAGAPAAAGQGCWRIGPLSLGMSPAEVEARMGPPVQARPLPADPARYRAEIFALPRDWRARMPASGGRRVRLRLVEVLFRQGRAAAIATDVPARIDGPSCAAGVTPPRVEIGGQPPGFAPFAAFAGVRLGDRVGPLSARFGRSPSFNASRDWLTWFPAPIAFGADPDAGRIVGMTIGQDEDAVTRADTALIHIVARPGACRIADLVFGR